MQRSLLILCTLSLGMAASVSPAHAGSGSTWFSKGHHTNVWTVKARLGKSFGTVDHNDTASGRPVTVDRSSGTDLEENDFTGLSIALDYGINDYFSVEGSVGYFTSPKGTFTSTSTTFLGTIAGEDDGSISRIPITFAALYHPLPYGMISPYVGAGYHYTVVSSSFKTIEAEDMSGGLLKIGADIWSKSNLGINVDVEHKLMSGVTDYTKLTNSNREDDATHDPTTVSIGLNYRF
jgi:outer membrane protein W